MTVRKWGVETLVNTNTTNIQALSSVTGLADGGYVVCWTDVDPAGGDASGASIKFQRYDAAGIKVGGEVIANFTAAGDQFSRDVVATDDGGFVIVWGDSNSSEYRRFNAGGVALDAGDRLLTLPGDQFSPELATLGSGFVLAFEDGVGDVRVQRFLANGDTDGAVIDVAVSGNGEQEPAIAEMADGGFVVAWEDSTTNRIRVRGFDAAGAPTFAAVNVSDITDTDVLKTSVTALAGGGFVVAWQNNDATPLDTTPSVHGRIVGSDGTLVGSEFAINTYSTGLQLIPGLAALPDGGFVAVYTSDNEVRGQVFDAVGGRAGAEFVVNTSMDNVQGDASVAALADGRFVVTWTDASTAHPDDDDSAAVRQQIFDPRDGQIYGTTAADLLLGHDAVDDELNGLAGADTLNGLGGADFMHGGEQGDTYVVDNVGDRAIELADQGIDVVQASASFALGANVENLTLTGAAAIDGTGNALANTITGNTAANVLTGGLATDTLNGGLGDDTYVLEDGSDVVVDTGGVDTVTSSIDRSLASFATIDNLTLLGSAINGTGNSLANVITGNNAANVLTGGLATDTLNGGLGNDTYVLENGNDVVTDTGGTADLVTSTINRSLAAAGLTTIEKLTLVNVAAALNGTGNTLANIITGNTFNNSLDGGIGNDTLLGLGGNDTLIGNAGKDISTGGAGNDTFRFLNKGHSFGALTDVITDFDDSGNDKIDVSTLFGPALIYRHNLAFTAAGQLRINDIAGADVIVQVNTGGSLAADFQIRLAATTLASMTANDFFL